VKTAKRGFSLLPQLLPGRCGLDILKRWVAVRNYLGGLVPDDVEPLERLDLLGRIDIREVQNTAGIPWDPVLPLVDDLIWHVRDRSRPPIFSLRGEGCGEFEVLDDPIADALLDHSLAWIPAPWSD
jgi:hypothetical protein